MLAIRAQYQNTNLINLVGLRIIDDLDLFHSIIRDKKVDKRMASKEIII